MLNFTTPHQTIMSKKPASLVTVPGASGYFGIAPDHVPVVAELKPGLVSITANDQSVTKYFVSGGFVFVHDDSTCDLSCIEAVPVEQIDPNRAKQGIDTYQKMLATAADEATSVKAQIGLEVHEAMLYAIGPN